MVCESSEADKSGVLQCSSKRSEELNDDRSTGKFSYVLSEDQFGSREMQELPQLSKFFGKDDGSFGLEKREELTNLPTR